MASVIHERHNVPSQSSRREILAVAKLGSVGVVVQERLRENWSIERNSGSRTGCSQHELPPGRNETRGNLLVKRSFCFVVALSFYVKQTASSSRDPVNFMRGIKRPPKRPHVRLRERDMQVTHRLALNEFPILFKICVLGS